MDIFGNFSIWAIWDCETFSSRLDKYSGLNFGDSVAMLQIPPFVHLGWKKLFSIMPEEWVKFKWIHNLVATWLTFPFGNSGIK